MFGIRFIKTKPTDYVLLFKKGRIKAQGAGLSFFYYAPRSSVVVVPAESRDILFMFKDMTSDFQECDIQGQLTYRVSEPEKLAALLDFTVDADGMPAGDGSDKLSERLVNIVQVTIREKLQSMPLINALTATKELVEHAGRVLREAPPVKSLGLDVIDFSIVRLSPTPDMSRALEAGTRERFLKDADQAIYERRNFAVEQERRIRENELQTQIAVEEKNRQIREEQMNAEIAVQEKQKALEESKMNTQEYVAKRKHEIDQQELAARIRLESGREELVKTQAKNQVEAARARAESIRLEMESLGGADRNLIDALVANQMDARQMMSRAFRELASNADKIGTLNISPELLASLLGEKEAPRKK